MNKYGDTYTAPVRLTHDDAVYWIAPHYRAWYQVEQHLLDGKVRRYVAESLRISAAKECGWAHYTTVTSEKDEGLHILIEHLVYEQPGYREIAAHLAPPKWMTFRKVGSDPRHTVIELPLRRLMYHGEIVRGALHDDVLYVLM